MDKRASILVAVIAVVIGGGLIYTLTSGSSDDSDQVTAAAPAGNGTTAGGDSSAADGAVAGGGTSVDGAATNNGGGSGSGGGPSGGGGSAAPGQYVDYSPELVASTPGTKLLFFHAPWCPQCNALEDDIETSGLPDGVTVFKVDYDSNQDLRQQYGVTIQTTMVMVDRNGKKLDSYVAYEEPTFDAVERALL